MMLIDLRLLAASAALFTLPAVALIAAGHNTNNGYLSWGVCALAFTAALALLVTLARRHIPSGPAWRTGPTLDAAAWATAVAACPILALLTFAFGGTEMSTAYGLALISFPFTNLQLDEALTAMKRRAYA